MRINVEDCLDSDFRYKLLSKKLGCSFKAKGLLVDVWRLGQKYWSEGESLVPENIWKIFPYSKEIIECGFAIHDGSGVYVCGSQKRFEWIHVKKESSSIAGKASAQARKLKYGSSVPMNASNQGSSAERAPNSRSVEPERRTEPNALSLSLSQTQTQTQTQKERERESTSSPLSSPNRQRPTPLLNKLWNNNSKNLPKCKAMNTSRQRFWQSRWRDNPSQEYWIDIIHRIDNSPFCKGTNKRGWKATIDFLLKPDTHLKVSEGAYENKSQDFDWEEFWRKEASNGNPRVSKNNRQVK